MGALALSLVLSAPAAAQAEAEPLPYLDDQGIELGTILVREFVDPFTDFEPSSPPAEGQRYALATLMFEAAEDQTFPAEPRHVQLQDASGDLYLPTWVPRAADAVLPDLQSQTLAPFDRISGVVPFVLPADAEIVRLLYRGEGQRLMPILELGETGVAAVGEPQAITDAEGTSLGGVTVREAVDPYTDFDPNWPPAEGQRYVMLDVAFQAAEDQAMQAAPSGVFLIGADGTMHRPVRIPRVPPVLLQDLEAQPLSPGDRVSGVVGFAIPQDQVLSGVVDSPEYDRFVPLVDL